MENLLLIEKQVRQKVAANVTALDIIDKQTQQKKELTLKTPRKPASENVICLCCLLNILENFSNLFLHAGKQCGPRSDCS